MRLINEVALASMGKIQTILACVCLALLAAGSGALAEPELKTESGETPQTYFSVSGLVLNMENETGVHRKLGWGGAGAVGVKFEKDFRAEIEYAYRSINAEAVNLNSDLESTTHSFMANLVCESMTRELSPYIGIGAGWGWANGKAGGLFPEVKLKRSHNDLAYQGLAGIKYKVDRKLDVSAGYRYFGIRHPGEDAGIHTFEMAMRLSF